MLAKTLGFFFALGACSALGGCSSDSTEDAPADTPDPVEPGAQPPDKDPGAGAGTASDATALAMNKLLLGDTDYEGNEDPNAWKEIGYNIDGIVSTKAGTNHCTLQPQANPAVAKTDGKGGVDNAFGASLLPIIKAVDANASATISNSLTNGDFTLIFKLDALDDEANQSDINGSLLGGGKLVNAAGAAIVPKFDGTDVWPVVPDLLDGPTINDAKVKFPSSYVTGHTWVSGPTRETINLTIAIQGTALTLEIRQAQVTMDLTGSGAAASATRGIIAGVMRTETLIEALRKVAGQFDTSLCAGSTFEGIAGQIRAGSDMMQDGTNGDPSKVCDGISIGLGFETSSVTIGEVLPKAAPSPNPCDAVQ